MSVAVYFNPRGAVRCGGSEPAMQATPRANLALHSFNSNKVRHWLCYRSLQRNP